MNNLLSELLIKLAQKEADEKRLQSRIASLEMLISAMISTLDDHKLIKLKGEIDQLMAQETTCGGKLDDIRGLLHNINRMAAMYPQE